MSLSAAPPLLVEFCTLDGRIVGTVTLPARPTFWSEGPFTPGEAFAGYAAFLGQLEAASRRFQASTGAAEAEALAELAELWADLNRRLRVREQGDGVWLTDVGLLLDADRASVRYWRPADDTLSAAQLDQLEALAERASQAGDVEFIATVKTYVPRLIAEVRRARARGNHAPT